MKFYNETIHLRGYETKVGFVASSEFTKMGIPQIIYFSVRLVPQEAL